MTADKNLELNIGHLSTVYHTNFLLCKNKEFEKELGGNINWRLYGTGPEMINAFRKGRLDIGYLGLPPALIGIDNGIKIKCVAGGHIEGTIMIAKSNYKTIFECNKRVSKTLSQFRRKSIGTPSKGSIHDVILNYYLDKYKLTNHVNVVHYDQPELIAIDIRKGLLEAAVGTPALAVFCSTIFMSHTIIPPNKLWRYNPSYGIFFREEIIEKKPEILEKFLSYHKKATTLIRTDPMKAAEQIAGTSNFLNTNYVKSILEISPRYCISLSKPMIKSTIKFAENLQKLKYIKKKLNISEIFHFDQVNYIHPEKDHY
ncbi:MAG: ABC transporter substrate-binding protein [Promethearchaeota archaeon]